MKRIFYLLFLLNFGTWAQETSLFEQGNAAYADQNYKLAVEKYQQILERGKTDVAVHFNLANAYYKLNEIAPSIYHYEKALQLAPNDEDVINNIVFARQMTVDALEVQPKTGFSKWVHSALAVLSTTGWAWAAIVFMVFFVLLFLLYYFSKGSLAKRLFFITGSFFFILAFVAVFMGFSRKDIEESRDYAIVFSEEVTVRNEPDERGEEIFYLHEGAKIRILNDFQQWYEFEIPGGNQGWLKKDAVKLL